MTGDRMGFTLTKDLTIDGQVKFENFYYQHNNDNAIFSNGKITVKDDKSSDGDFYFKDGQPVLPGAGNPFKKIKFNVGRGYWENVWDYESINLNIIKSHGK